MDLVCGLLQQAKTTKIDDPQTKNLYGKTFMAKELYGKYIEQLKLIG
jgi:hypothetical protein